MDILRRNAMCPKDSMRRDEGMFKREEEFAMCERKKAW